MGRVRGMTTSPVSHPAHYTSSPSGVECIELVEWMSFTLGNAMKYLWRYEEKDNPAQDLDKCLWYIERYRKMSTYAPSPSPQRILDKLLRVRDATTDPMKREALWALGTVGMGRAIWPGDALYRAEQSVQALRARLVTGA